MKAVAVKQRKSMKKRVQGIVYGVKGLFLGCLFLFPI